MWVEMSSREHGVSPPFCHRSQTLARTASYTMLPPLPPSSIHQLTLLDLQRKQVWLRSRLRRLRAVPRWGRRAGGYAWPKLR